MGFESNKSGGSHPEKSSANVSQSIKKPDPKYIGKIALGGGKK